MGLEIPFSISTDYKSALTHLEMPKRVRHDASIEDHIAGKWMSRNESFHKYCITYLKSNSHQCVILNLFQDLFIDLGMPKRVANDTSSNLRIFNRWNVSFLKNSICKIVCAHYDIFFASGQCMFINQLNRLHCSRFRTPMITTPDQQIFWSSNNFIPLSACYFLICCIA